MLQLSVNLNRIHDSVGKASRTANQAHVTAKLSCDLGFSLRSFTVNLIIELS